MCLHKIIDRTESYCAVVLGADANYTEMVLTTIKSVDNHNQKMRYYILNSDIPQDWFLQLRKKLALIGSEIIDIKVNTIGQGVKTNDHISLATYLRFYIPQVIPEDRVLYLDSDLIVTRDIRHLFDLDLQGNLIGAVNDLDIQSDVLPFGVTDTFNAGVLLFDNAACKHADITNTLINTMTTVSDRIWLGDQSIFNIVFKDNWYNLGINYNCLLGANIVNYNNFRGHNFGRITKENLPTILHFNSSEKPWKTQSWMQCSKLW